MHKQKGDKNVEISPGLSQRSLVRDYFCMYNNGPEYDKEIYHLPIVWSRARLLH